VNNIDVLCVTQPRFGRPPLTLSPVLTASHPRVARALRYRDDVRAWETPGGIVVLGRGVAGRWEVGLEVEPGYQGKGLGRELAVAARHLVPGGAPLWAQIAPGNAASVRAFLAAGYQPVGAEALLPLA
jgi:RimJ/RimL family protein N-acetyltransferase